MRIGVNTGRVFTGDFGPTYRRSYRVFGDAINTAARVMSKAAAGQVLSTEIVLERSRTTFETTPIEPFAAKGKSEPIRASIVGPVIGQREAERARRPSSAASASSRRSCASSRTRDSRSGWIVELSGGPGLGKTRLLQDLIARAGDVFVFHTRCEEYESSTPYFPLRAPFRAVLGLAADRQRGRRRAAPPAWSRENVDASIVPWVPLFGVLLGVEHPAHAGDQGARRALHPRAARRRDDALPLHEPRRHDDHARRRGRPAHGRVEPRPAAPPGAGRDRPQAGAVRDPRRHGQPLRRRRERRAPLARVHARAR